MRDSGKGIVMRSGVIVKKVGMTRLFFEDGRQIPEEFVFDAIASTDGPSGIPDMMRSSNRGQSGSEGNILEDFLPTLDFSSESFAHTRLTGIDTGGGDIF